MRKSTIILPVIAVLVALALSSIFIVDEREKALVLQFGQIKSVKEEPGIGFKIPLIQDVVKYDDRILSIDTNPIEVTPSDDRRLVVDAFARYRIADVVQFRQAVGVGGIRTAEDRLESILIAQIREVLGADQVTSNTILSSDRVLLMNRIRDNARERASNLGIEVVDVRLKQTNLPKQNLDATFARMRAERQREAEDERARGREAAQRVSAQADRTVVEITSDAERQADITRGEADAERNKIFAEAYGQDPSFFEFYRSLTAYTRALKAGNSTLVMSPDSEFFNFLKTSGGDLPPVERAQSDAAQSDAGQSDAGQSDAGQSRDQGQGDAQPAPERQQPQANTPADNGSDQPAEQQPQPAPSQ